MTVQTLRPQLAARLHQRLAAFRDGFRHNLALIGPPGSGKSFQLQRLLAEPPPGLLLLYCPLYRESCRSFLSRFLSAVVQAGPGLPNTAAAVQAAEQLVGRRLYGEAFNRALDTVPVLSKERGMPCVLVLDEFLFLEELGLGHAFHELGKRVMTWNSTLFILSSSACFRARLILRERLQLLFGQFELLELEAVDPASAEAWLHQELRGIRGAREIVPFLLQWLGGSPWYLTVFLKRFRELAALRKGPPALELLFLQTAWDILGVSDGPLHQWCGSQAEMLAHSRTGSRALEALLQIADNARTTTAIAGRIGRAGLSAALQLLVEQDLVERNGMCWTIRNPVLRCWLSTVYAAQRREARASGPEMRARFDQYLRTLWTQWTQRHQLSFAQQIVELFGRFNEDTVSLDAKTGRLPKFEAIRTQPPAVPATEAAGRGGADTYLVADGQGRRWCAAVQTGPVGEQEIARFDAFCRGQSPKPSRKLIIVKTHLDETSRLLAKAANMWVWEPQDLRALMELYGQP